MGKSNKIENTTKKNIAIIIAIVLAVVCAGLIGGRIAKNKQLSEQKAQYSAEEMQLRAGETVKTGKVIVNYLDKDGNPIIESTTKTGKVGEEYDVERQSIAGYTKTGDEPITRAGVYSLQDTIVDFYYKKVEEEVKTKTEQAGVNGNTENSINVMFNNPKSARDYGVRIITKDEKGNVLNGGEFSIKKGEDELRRGKVTDGSFYVGKIAVEEEGKVTYGIEEIKAVLGYKKIEDIINLGINGTWNDEDKKFEITLDDINIEGVTARVETNDEIIIEVENPKYKDMYEIEIVNKSNDEVINGGVFKVTKEDTLIKEGKIENGVLPVGEFEITGDRVETYTVEEISPADGYERVISKDNPGLVTIKTVFDPEEEKYIIEVTYNDIPGFTAELGENGKVTVYVESKKIPQGEPEQKEEYDLAIKKFVSDIDGRSTTNREPQVKIENGEVKYTQNEEIEKAANEQEVTYTLRVYNESDTKGKGKRIIEHIPDGLVFLPENKTNKEYGWNLYKLDKDGDLVGVKTISEATVVATDYLVDKEIEGFNKEAGELPKYEDVRAVFEIDEDKITSKDRIIENKVEIEPNENDTNRDNDVTTEKIYVKYFDLAITKYIKEVKVTTQKGETTKKIGEEQKGKLVKIDVARSDVESTTIRVTYGLKVKNVGEIAGYATEIADYMPEDFELVKDGAWTVRGNKAVSTRLENKLLNPGESTTIEITFDWKLTEDNVGLKSNEAEITAYENEYNAKDLTDDNKDREDMLVAIKTGSTILMIVMVSLVVLVGATGIVYKIKKGQEK